MSGYLLDNVALLIHYALNPACMLLLLRLDASGWKPHHWDRVAVPIELRNGLHVQLAHVQHLLALVLGGHVRR